MLELRNSGKTMVFVSHGMDNVKKLCNRAIWLNQGVIKMDGDTETVTQAYLQEVV